MDRLQPRHVIALSALVMLTTFALSFAWEHGLEETALGMFGIAYDRDFDEAQRWRFIATSVGFSALSMIVPTLLVLRTLIRRREIDAELAHSRAMAKNLARHDPLTGLPNRRVFSNELDKAIRGAEGRPFALILLDVDHLKTINDTYGHAGGDAVLCAAAKRLRVLVDDHGQVGRLGGDEFAVILQPSSPVEAARFVRTALSALKQPVDVDGTIVTFSTSFGIALDAAGGGHGEQLIRAADIALQKAKASKRGSFEFFDPRMEEDLRARRALEAEILSSIEAGRFMPFYQPLVRMADGALQGFEVLARWDHPTAGILPPAMFIPVAGEMGVLTRLSQSVLRQACLDANTWPRELMISFNVSPVEMGDTGLANRILSVVSQTGLNPQRLEVEITEDAVMADIPKAKAFISQLQSRGVKVALDDFGTGYSSLAMLRNLNFQKIKIDRSFANAAESDEDALKLLDSIIYLGRRLGLETTAEGIETEASARHIAASQCTYGQGYLFGRPMPASTAEDYIAQNGAPSLIRALA